MYKAVMVPAIYSTLVTTLLYYKNRNLPAVSYFSIAPYFILIARPLGIAWNSSFLSRVNKDVFPPQMKSYGELYLTSPRAIAYDTILNHLFYNNILSGVVLLFTYSIRRINDYYQGNKGGSLWNICSACSVDLLKTRILVSIISIIGEYWLSFLFVKKTESGYIMSIRSKKTILTKDLLLTVWWNAYLFRTVNQAYNNSYQH